MVNLPVLFGFCGFLDILLVAFSSPFSFLTCVVVTGGGVVGFSSLPENESCFECAEPNLIFQFPFNVCKISLQSSFVFKQITAMGKI